MRSELFLIRNSPMLIWVWLHLIRNGLFLIGVCLPQMKEKQLLSTGWMPLFSESLSIAALREDYRDVQS